MEEKKTYLGYDEEYVRRIFRDSKDQVDSNSRISTTPTLEQLVEASGKLLKENKDFLHMIYNDLDD